MKTLIIYVVMLSLFTACGKGGGGGGSQARSTSPLAEELNEQEKQLVTELVNLKQVEDKTLLKSLLQLDTLNENTLKKLDQHMSVNCSGGICNIIATGERP